jgi:hypothetical protein
MKETQKILSEEDGKDAIAYEKAMEEASSMVTASIVIKRLERSRNLIEAERDTIQAIINEYEEVITSAETALASLEEAIDELTLLTIKEV